LERKIRISNLENHGDIRGLSYALPPQALDFLGRVADLYLAATAPGAIRGNHFHLRKNEALVLLPGTPWSLHWDDGEGTPAQHRNFDGSCAVLVLISPGASNAVRNDGDTPLWLIACSSDPYDATTVVARRIL
jgi:dTDP-4-dehydrorhamnose 3,5-epimerase-like enzyme